jgi:hypothetical protein
MTSEGKWWAKITFSIVTIVVAILVYGYAS